MKKMFITLLSVAALFVFNSCGSDKGIEDGEKSGKAIIIDASQLNRTVYADETPQSVQFTASGDWTASVEYGSASRAISWLFLDKYEGVAGKITLNVSIETNYTGADRSGRIVISCQGATQDICVEQKATLQDGTIAVNPYRTIKTVADFKEFASDLKKMTRESDEDGLRKKWGRTVVLENDLDFLGEKMNALIAPYNGGCVPIDFDGNGHTISNVNMVNSGWSSHNGWRNDRGGAGLFAMVSYGHKVSNLHVEGSVTNTNEHGTAGGIASGCDGLIEGCSFKGSVKGDDFAGGIVATNGFDKGIRSCWVREGTTVEATYIAGYGSPQDGSAGGIVGYSTTHVTSCYSLASQVKGARFSGGIVGSLYASDWDMVTTLDALYSLKTANTPSLVVGSVTGDQRKLIQNTGTFDGPEDFWASGCVETMNSVSAVKSFFSSYRFVKDTATGYAKIVKQ